MSKLLMYCLCLEDALIDKVEKLNYIPVGLGKKNFSKRWLRDNTGKNISQKNPYYGEYTFHYWLWKNHLDNIKENTWIGFCTYRRFWNQNLNQNNSFDIFKDSLNQIPANWENYETVLADRIDLAGIRWIKILKYGKFALMRNPKAFFKSGRNLRFNFDMFHGNGLIDKAIELLDDDNKEDFRNFVNTNTSYNQCNLFICRSKDKIKKYYDTIFTWLEKCEEIFGFNLIGYNKIRLYGFLAERFLPYWFLKNSKCIEWSISFKDLNDSKYK